MPNLSLLIKPVSGACNLRCRYCFYLDESARRQTACFGTMSETTLQTLVRRAFAYADGPVSFAFQGGEPLLAGKSFYRQVLALQKQYNTRRLPVTNALQTNGTLLDDEWAELLPKVSFWWASPWTALRPCTTVTVSMLPVLPPTRALCREQNF